MIHIRRAGPLDAPMLAELLNAIVEKGGTTAITTPVSRTIITEWMARNIAKSAWHLAEDDSGQILGFQWIEPKENLPQNTADIATFTRIGQTGLGVGSALFNQTCRAARDLGYRWINASIRTDNTGGLAYYQSRGFENHSRSENIHLANGMVTSKINKRFRL